MVRLIGGVSQCGKDVFAFEIGIIRQDFFKRGSLCKQFEHIRHTDAEPTNTRAASALAGFDRDSIKTLVIH